MVSRSRSVTVSFTSGVWPSESKSIFTRHGFPAGFLVLEQVEVAPGGDALQFLGAEWKLEKNIDGGPGVMSQLIFFLPVFFQRLAAQADALIKFQALLDPIFVPDFPAPIRL